MSQPNRLLAFVLSFSFVLNTHPAHAARATESEPMDIILSSDELSYLVLNRTSPIRNSEALFRDVRNAPDFVRNAYDSEIANNAALQAFASEGKMFRDFYIKTLNQGFGGDMLLWATDPDAAIYRDLVRINMKVELQDREISDSAARRKAWREALSKYNLPDDLSHGDVVEKARQNNIFERALQSYSRLYIYYLDETTPQLGTPPFDFHVFMRDVERKINRAREANFEQAVKILIDLRKLPMDFISLSDQTQVRVKIEELSKSKVMFVKDSADKGTHRLKVEKWFDWYVHLIDSFWTKSQAPDVNAADAFYNTHFYQPSNPTHLISLDLGGHKINLSERNYAEVLHQLLSQANTGTSVDRVWKARYIMEASRRDVMLSDALAFLKRQRRSLSDLIKKYSGRVEQNRSTPNDIPTSLTERFRLFNEIHIEADNLTGVRWAGYQVHPDYWLVRDFVSVRANGIDYTELKNGRQIDHHPAISLEEIQTTKQFLMTDKAEKKNKAYREGSTSRRSMMFANKLAFITAVTLSALGGIVSTTAMVTKFTVDNFINEDGGNTQSLTIQDNDRHENLSFDSSKGNGKVIFDVGRLKPGVDLPIFYNILGKSNLPEVMQRSFNTFGEEPDLVSEIKLGGSDKVQADIKITTHVPYEPTDGRVPILTPDYYQLKSIKVTMGGVELQSPIDYKVYQIPNNGLYYFEAANYSDARNGRYHYEVTFSAATPRGLPQQISEIDQSILKQVNKILRDSGSAELSGNLDKAKTLKGQAKVSLDTIGAIFSQSGVYTFDPRGSKIGDHDNPFYSASRYLRADGTYYFQCTGSNYLLGTYLNEVYSKNPAVRNRVKVEQVNGFVLQNEEGNLTFPGHRRTLISDIKLKNRYVILDATPVKMDPKYKNQEKKHPFYYKDQKKQMPHKRPQPNSDVFLRREDSELRLVDSDKKAEPQTKQNQEKKIAEKVDTLIKLKGELRESVLGLLRQSGHTIKRDTIHAAMRDLFFLVDLVTANLSQKKGKELLVDELIAYQTGIPSAGSGNYQAKQFDDFRTQYLSRFGSHDGVIIFFLDDVLDRFSKLLQRVAESDQRGTQTTHGYLLDEKVLRISFEILKTLGDKRVRDGFTTTKKCSTLLAQ